MAELIIRTAEKGDAEAIAALEQLCFAVPWSREAILQDLTENPRAFYLVAEADGKPAGYIGLWIILDEGHINNVAVAPELRRQHIASQMMETLLQQADAAGINSFTLEVRQGNLAARKLYANFGFQEAGIRKGYYEDNGEDAVIMWRF